MVAIRATVALTRDCTFVSSIPGRITPLDTVPA